MEFVWKNNGGDAMKNTIRNIIVALVIGITAIMVLSLSACSKNESKPEQKSLFVIRELRG